MEQQIQDVTVVHDNRILFWIWVIMLPIGTYFLSGALLQSFGFFLPLFSEPQYPIGWGTRLFVGVILIVWLQAIPDAVAGMRRPNIVLLVSDHGIEFPGFCTLKWSEIDRIANRFGTLKFYPKDASLGHVDFFPPHASYKEWRMAKSRIRRHAPKALARSI